MGQTTQAGMILADANPRAGRGGLSARVGCRMGVLAIETGRLAVVQKSLTVTGLDFGYKYTGFRGVDRFVDQIGDDQVGLITWPGGTLSEKNPERYGFNFDGLFNPALKRPGLADMFAIARDEGAGLSVVLPTARYEGDDAGLRADLRAFMGKVLSGHYGALPSHLQFEVGNEWYFAFGGSAADARAYGHVADIYVEEISAALNDPAVNRIGADIGIAVQCGRTLTEDALVRSEFDDDRLAEVDMVIHHRFPFTAVGVDKSVDEIGRILDAWEADAKAVGGDRPELFLGAYNVASLTRDEALDAYVKSQAALGHVIDRQDIDVAHRSDVGFETFWQNALGKRDYGAEHPRLLLEAFAEYGGEGMGAAATYGSDMEHSGRLSTRDASGRSQDFVGQELLDMLGESVKGTRLLKVSLTNDRNDEVWAYAYENADKLVVFLSADDTPPGKFTVSLKGIGTKYKAVYGDSLTAEVPDDWMARFGIADNAQVDETNEGKGFAIGIRQAVTPKVGSAGVTVDLDDPHEVIRLSFAKTDAGLREIEGFSDDDGVELAGPRTMRTDGTDGFLADDPSEGSAQLVQFARAEDHEDPDHDAEAATEEGGDFGAGGLVLALLPLLFLL